MLAGCGVVLLTVAPRRPEPAPAAAPEPASANTGRWEQEVAPRSHAEPGCLNILSSAALGQRNLSIRQALEKTTGSRKLPAGRRL